MRDPHFSTAEPSYIRSMPPKIAPARIERVMPGENRGAAFWRLGLPLAVASAEGTIATQEVDVRVVTPPLGRVEVKVLGTGLEVVLVPEKMVDCVGVFVSSSSVLVFSSPMLQLAKQPNTFT